MASEVVVLLCWAASRGEEKGEEEESFTCLPWLSCINDEFSK